MTVLVDMDGVLEDLLTPWCNAVNEENGTDVHPEDIVEWDISKAFPTLTRNRIYKPLHDDEFWNQVKPIDGAVEGLKQIVDAGHEVFVVTTSDYRTLKSKMDNVLFKYFPYLTWKNVIITSRKQMVSGDVLIDDGLHNLVNGMYEKIVFDAPYNRQAKGISEAPEMMYRARNWDEVVAIVEALGKELHEYCE